MLLRFDNRGSAVIAALWVLFFLAAVAVALHSHVSAYASATRRIRDGYITLFAASAGVKNSLIILEQAGEKVYNYVAWPEPWYRNKDAFKDIEVGTGSYSVRSPMSAVSPGSDGAVLKYGLNDEESKINVNTASRPVFSRFLQLACGLDEPLASEVAGSVISWRESGEGDVNAVDAAYYAARGYSPSNRAFRTAEELLLVRGMNNELFDLIKPHITVFGEGAVNLNTAEILILRSIGMKESLAEKIARYRKGFDGEPGTRHDNFFTARENIKSELVGFCALTEDERKNLSVLIDSGLVDVRSGHFSGLAEGRISGSGGGAEIYFVISKNEGIVLWQQQ